MIFYLGFSIYKTFFEINSIKFSQIDKFQKNDQYLLGVLETNKSKKCNIGYSWEKQIDGKVISFSLKNRNEDNERIKTILKYMHDNYLNEFDWFLIFDQETFVNVDNLDKILTSLNPLEKHFIGPQIDEKSLSSNTCFKSTHLVISRELLRNLGLVFDRCSLHYQCLELVNGLDCELTNKVYLIERNFDN